MERQIPPSVLISIVRGKSPARMHSKVLNKTQLLPSAQIGVVASSGITWIE